MFVSTLPFRVQLDGDWSFDEVVKHVREQCLSTIEHSQYPLQHILVDCGLNQANAFFLATMFDLISTSSNVTQFSLNGTLLEEASINQTSEMAKFDFSTTFAYNPTSNIGKLCSYFVCSEDMFENKTIQTIAQRFQYLISQLFAPHSSNTQIKPLTKSIILLDVILPGEAEEILKWLDDYHLDAVYEGIVIH
ncbi:unnamed protein product [Adineta ricciae]|uniref:Condensation domain-containing protein n=1 Tax=Adineta ricciae TaxID=249248 RepID=A0A815TB86_ADIRI|nr:unnamed protein product [Adineta ricciae]CAF1547904.1 unnamed protein product [Adineta ricciae]